METSEGGGPKTALLVRVVTGGLSIGLPGLAARVAPEHEEPIGLVHFQRAVHAGAGQAAPVDGLQQLAFACKSGIGHDQHPGIRFGDRRGQLLVQALGILGVEAPDLVEDDQRVPGAGSAPVVTGDRSKHRAIAEQELGSAHRNHREQAWIVLHQRRGRLEHT